MAQPSFLEESSQDAVINANIVELERRQEEHDSNDESTGNYSTPPKPMDVHMQRNQEKHQRLVQEENNRLKSKNCSSLIMKQLEMTMHQQMISLHLVSTIRFFLLVTFRIIIQSTLCVGRKNIPKKNSFFFPLDKLLDKARGIQEQQPLLSKIR